MTPRFPEQRVFNKLHHASARSTGLIQELEIYGRVSEEGFEAAHPMIESMMKNTLPLDLPFITMPLMATLGRSSGNCSSLNGKMCTRCVNSNFNIARPSLCCRHGSRKKVTTLCERVHCSYNIESHVIFMIPSIQYSACIKTASY